MKAPETHYLTISIGREARNYAQTFAAAQATEEKSQQVYRNTIAVWAVNSFLSKLNFTTYLEAGDSWHPVISKFHDIADLVIADLGKLECRPVMPDSEMILLPPEVREDRIGYVAVRFPSASLREQDEVQLLGFVRAADIADSATIEFDQLEPIENLIDYLYRLESGMEVLQSESEVNEKVQQLLATTPMSVIIARLEQIFRKEPEYEWRAKGGNLMLSGSVVGGMNRGDKGTDGDEVIAAQDLAENLLEKLAEIWGDPL